MFDCKNTIPESPVSAYAVAVGSPLAASPRSVYAINRAHLLAQRRLRYRFALNRVSCECGVYLCTASSAHRVRALVCVWVQSHRIHDGYVVRLVRMWLPSDDDDNGVAAPMRAYWAAMHDSLCRRRCWFGGVCGSVVYSHAHVVCPGEIEMDDEWKLRERKR